METRSYPPINNLHDLAQLKIECGWGGFGNIQDEGLKAYIIQRCREMNCDDAMDYLPDSWGGDEKAFHLVDENGKHFYR